MRDYTYVHKSVGEGGAVRNTFCKSEIFNRSFTYV